MAGDSLSGMAGALTGGALSATPQFNYASLQEKYHDFSLPHAVVELGGKVVASKEADLLVNNLSVELSSGFEASIARFRLYNVYNRKSGKFRYEGLKDQLAMGTSMAISLGYSDKLELIFVGFVSGVSFDFEESDLPFIEVTGMDIKGMMMAGTYANQLTADSYGEAVREILLRTGYQQLSTTNAVLGIEVTDTPDLDPALLTALKATEAAQQAANNAKQAAEAAKAAAEAAGDLAPEALEKLEALQEKAATALSAVEEAKKTFSTAKEINSSAKQAVEDATAAMATAPPSPVPVPVPPGPVSAYTVEMTAESDYEFVVKAAKKFNYEFFVDRGTVLFRKAKANADLLLDLSTTQGLLNFHIEYSITGLVGAVEARAMNPGDGTVISAKSTLDRTVSTGNAAKKLVKQGKKVLIDPTINSQTQADARVASLMEDMSYRLGTLEAKCVGIPELMPGRFLRISGLGAPADNDFYAVTVTHEFSDQTGYTTKIAAKADQVKGDGPL